MAEAIKWPSGDGKLEEGAGELLVGPCNCGRPNCRSIVFAMRNPGFVPIEGMDELACQLYYPKACIPDLIQHLRRLM